MTIRAMTPGDISRVVRIHLDSFPGFFLSFLGPRFLALLYEGILKSPQGLVLVSESEAGIEGFVAGVTDQSSFYTRLIKRDAVRFALASLGALARRPRIAPRLLRALRQSGHARRSAAKACLMSIAVLPGTSGRGVGRRLVASFGSELAARGVRRYCLTTDRDGNDRVNDFYRQLGFQLASTFETPEGRAMNEYVMSMDEPPAGLE